MMNNSPSVDTESMWAKMLTKCSNPLGLTQDMVEASKEACKLL